MSIFAPADNVLVTCPYDEAHKVKGSRLQLHLAKCKLNHLDAVKKICPFNASHQLLQGEYDHHLLQCPNRDALDRQLAQKLDKNNPFKGRTDVPPYSDPFILNEVDEVWEADSTAVELEAPPLGAVVEPPPMAKPAERRKLYMDLHQSFRGTEQENGKTSPSEKLSGPPRQPKQPSETQILQTNGPTIQSLGLGRGKPTSRIAANIFPKPNESPKIATYSSIVKDMSNLGLGRGEPVKKGPTPVYNSDDFPALGLGRGSMLPPKQSLRAPGAKPEK